MYLDNKTSNFETKFVLLINPPFLLVVYLKNINKL